MNVPIDYFYLLQHAWDLFPAAIIDVVHDGEIIYIDVDGQRFTFEAGSDDDRYVFRNGETSFTIPLMENPEDVWDFLTSLPRPSC